MYVSRKIKRDIFTHYAYCCFNQSGSCTAVTQVPTSPLCIFFPQYPPPPPYLFERFRLLCAETPLRSAGSTPGRAGSAHGWWWSLAHRWPGYARLPGPGQW